MAVMSKHVDVAFEVAPGKKDAFLAQKHNNASQAIERAKRCSGKHIDGHRVSARPVRGSK